MIATKEPSIKKSAKPDFIKKLKLKSISQGACTGTNWLNASGEMMESFSPADGKLIGKIKSASRNDYEKVLTKAGEAFKRGVKFPRPSVAKLFGKSAKS